MQAIVTDQRPTSVESLNIAIKSVLTQKISFKYGCNFVDRKHRMVSPQFKVEFSEVPLLHIRYI